MGEDFGKFFRRQLFDRLRLASIAANPGYVQHQAAEAMENVSAYTVLRLLALDPKARDLPSSGSLPTPRMADGQSGTSSCDLSTNPIVS